MRFTPRGTSRKSFVGDKEFKMGFNNEDGTSKFWRDSLFFFKYFHSPPRYLIFFI